MRTERVARYALVALLSALAVLFVSGLFLTFHYRPTYGREHGAAVAHRVASFAALGSAAVLAACGVARRRWWGLALPPILVVATVNGFDLRWSQLALWSVVVGIDFSGVLRAAFDDERVRFVFVGDDEISQAAYRTAVLLHLVVLPVLLGVFLFLARRVRGAGGHHDSARRNHGGRRHDAGAGPPQG